MHNLDKKYITFIVIVIIVIAGSGLSFIYINKPMEVPAIRTVMGSDASTASESAADSKESSGKSVTEELSSDINIFPIEINTAGKNELMQLNGIGEAIAQRIIDYRASGNYFYSAEEIKKISGIGDSVYDKIKDKIYVNAENLPVQTAQTTVAEVTGTASPNAMQTIISTENQGSTAPVTTYTAVYTTATAAKTEITVDFPIDINSADAEELMCLNGIGEVLADRIIEYREDNGGFYSIEEIMEVSGIGKAIFNKIKSKIYADTSNLKPRASSVSETTVSEIKDIPTVNINTATADEFEMLPKITHELAVNIVDFRENVLGGKFSSIYEILYVKGITNDIYNEFNDYITAE